MTKPFDFEELLARLNSLNRRNLKNKSNIINF
jgi:DNA-binding response OmpR family regulator